jgi:glyoxylase I family protein
MKLSSVNHTAIICSDYQKSKEFYTQILGFEIIKETFWAERNSYKLYLEGDNCQIELFSFLNPKHQVTLEVYGLCQFLVVLRNSSFIQSSL